MLGTIKNVKVLPRDLRFTR